MQKTHTGRCASLQPTVGLAAAGMTGFNFPEGWGWVGGNRERKRSVLKSLPNILFWYFLYREWTISKGLIIQKHQSDLAKAYAHG